MFNFSVSIPVFVMYFWIKDVLVTESLANKSSNTWYPNPVSTSNEKLGPCNGGHERSPSPTKLIVSIIGLDCILVIQTFWLVVILAGNG